MVKENKRNRKKIHIKRIIFFIIILLIIGFIYNKSSYRYFTTYFKDHYQVVIKDNPEVAGLYYYTILEANGKPDKEWKEGQIKYLEYSDGRLFVFDLRSNFRLCRVEITNPEYRFGRKKIGIGTKKKVVERAYKNSYHGLYQDVLHKEEYYVEDGNREVIFYFDDEWKVNKIIIGDAEVYHGVRGWKKVKDNT